MTSGSLDSYDNFMGDDSDYKDWYGFVGQSRDSLPLERSNFQVVTAELERIDPGGDDWFSASYGHWAVGWIEEIYVRPGSKCQDYAEEVAKALADYPVLDDEHFSEVETEEANKTWQNCFNDSERLNYIREFRDQFEFDNFADMRSCVKGEYFAGYASDLIY